jgi:3-deoxy-7-phosphoheptulonate synthase
MTSQLVSECVGGEFGVNKDEVEIKYETLVDPRLNGAQSMEYVTKLVELLKQNKHD